MDEIAILEFNFFTSGPSADDTISREEGIHLSSSSWVLNSTQTPVNTAWTEVALVSLSPVFLFLQPGSRAWLQKTTPSVISSFFCLAILLYAGVTFHYVSISGMWQVWSWLQLVTLGTSATEKIMRFSQTSGSQRGLSIFPENVK